MAEIINLRQERKRKEREEAAKKASENRTRYGEGKTAKTHREKDRKKLEETLEGANLDGANLDG
ncbi:DUF4169 domain-containing protein, partial [Enterococcus hirae]